MICNSKSEFLTGLRIALEQNNITDTRDILTDFRQHFDDGEAAGETEAEVCRKLGDVDEIVKQYISDLSENSPAAENDIPDAGTDASGFGADTYSNAQQYSAPPQYGNVQYEQQSAGFQPSGGKIAGVLCLDVFLYSWALPTLASLIVALFSVTLAFAISGVAVLVAGVMSCFLDMGGIMVTGFAPVSLIMLGIMMSALAGMLVIASIGSVKGFINLIIAIVNQHAKVFVGHKIWKKIGGKKEVQAQ